MLAQALSGVHKLASVLHNQICMLFSIIKGTWGRICEKINIHFKFFLMIMGDEAFQTKKNEPTHISLRCLEQAVCCIMYCNSGPNFPRSPADVTSDDVECASSTAWIQEEEARWTQTSVCAVWILSWVKATLRTKPGRHPNIYRIRVRVMEAASTGTLPRGLADGCSYPNGRRVTIESYL